jgi:hypothetical protein
MVGFIEEGNYMKVNLSNDKVRNVEERGYPLERKADDQCIMLAL